MHHTKSSDNNSSSYFNKHGDGYMYKKSSYHYSSSDNNNTPYYAKTGDQNIDQLDALLEDLKTERQVTRDRDLLTAGSTRTIERDRTLPAGSVTKTVKVVKTSQHSGDSKVPENIDNYLSTNAMRGSSSYTSLQRSGVNKSLPSASIYGNKSTLNESTRTLENVELIPSTTLNVNRHLADDLNNISLSDDILPVPGTKVTTTVRTYTYEIPAGTPVKTSNVLYSNIQQNESNTSTLSYPPPLPETRVPQTVAYNTESYSTINNTTERPSVTNRIYEVREHRENHSNWKPLPPTAPYTIGHPSDTSKTIIYNTTENIITDVETDDTPKRSGTSPLGPPGPTTNKYFYQEYTNSVNSTQKPNYPGEPYHPQGHHHPNSPNTHSPLGYPPTTYNIKYSSSTVNRHHGPEPLTSSPVRPSPFPVDTVEHITNGNPPQRVDDLMQSFQNVDAVDRADLISPIRKREVETAVASPNQQRIPSINKAGKEVYYPPGHDVMITKREEMSAGSAAGGRWAKGSGMYEYESGSKSKTKTKSGGAMVPVCLPLCCAMPCSIM